MNFSEDFLLRLTNSRAELTLIHSRGTINLSGLAAGAPKTLECKIMNMNHANHSGWKEPNSAEALASARLAGVSPNQSEVNRTNPNLLKVKQRAAKRRSLFIGPE